MSANTQKRLGRIEQIVGDAACICTDAIEFVVIEPDWDKARINQAEEAKHIACPTHGRTKPIILHLSPGDVDG